MNLAEYISTEVAKQTGNALMVAPEHKAVQLVKHWDEVSDKHKGAPYWYVKLKKDGNFCTIINTRQVGGKCKVKLFNRTGKAFTNVAELESRIAELKLPNGAFFGEICSDICHLEALSGVINPNRVKPLNAGQHSIRKRLYVALFDGVSLKEFQAGVSRYTCETRMTKLIAMCQKCNIPDDEKIESVNKGTSCIDIALTCIVPNKVKTAAGIDAHADEYIDAGQEGIVICHPEAKWEAGHKNWHQMKKVRGVSYDLRCVGWEEGKGKYKGKIANLLFAYKDGETIKCMLGKGWTHELAQEMYEAEMRTDDYVVQGKIFQVYALQESAKGKLRLPKVGELRHDKLKSDLE